MALIKQSNRQITVKRPRPPAAGDLENNSKHNKSEKAAKDGDNDGKVKDRKRDKKKRFKADLKAMINSEQTKAADNGEGVGNQN